MQQRGQKCPQMLSNIMSKNHENMKREAEDRSSWKKRLSQTCHLMQNGKNSQQHE